MAGPIGALRAELSAGYAQFASDMKKAKDAVKTNAAGMQKAMHKVGQKFTEAATALNKYAGYAIAGAIAASVVFIKKQIDIADKMGKLAQQTGTTSEYLSAMALVASQGGTTLEAVAKGVKKLSKNMDDVRRGMGGARYAFEELNIKITDNTGVLLDSDEVMKDIADKFKEMEDGAEKTAYAIKIFGRAGAELIPILNGGRNGIEQLQEKAEKMGLVISTKTALEAAYLNDELDILIKTVEGTGRSLALDLIPWLNDTYALLKLAKEESGFLGAAWVGLGAAGKALFGTSLEKQLAEKKQRLKILEEDIGKTGWGETFAKFLGSNPEKDKIERINKLKQEIIDLESYLSREETFDKARMEESLKRQQEEAEQRRKNTELIREQAKARIDEALAAQKAQTIKTKMAELDAKSEKVLNEIMSSLSRERNLEALVEMPEEATDKWEKLGNVIQSWGRDSADAIVQFTRSGKTSFADMVNSMIDDMLRMIVYQQITGPLFAGIGSFLGLKGAAKGNVFQNGNVIPFGSGGVVTRPTVFPMAQGAGIMGEAGPEAILPLKRGANGDLGVAGSGGNMQVNIYNNVDANVSTKERTTADGSKAIDVYIDQAIAKKLGQFGSQSNKAIRQNFGARQQLVGR
jgi:hypothetical protein